MVWCSVVLCVRYSVWFHYDIWLFVIHVIHNLFLRLLLRQEVAIRPLRWHFWGLCSRKRYAIYAFPVWFMYANYALYLIIWGVPKWNHYVRLYDLEYVMLLILMPLLHDFVYIRYAMTLWYGMLFMHCCVAFPSGTIAFVCVILNRFWSFEFDATVE